MQPDWPGCYSQCISAMPEHQQYSFEELRHAHYDQNGKESTLIAFFDSLYIWFAQTCKYDVITEIVDIEHTVPAFILNRKLLREGQFFIDEKYLMCAAPIADNGKTSLICRLFSLEDGSHIHDFTTQFTTSHFGMGMILIILLLLLYYSLTVPLHQVLV